MKKIRCWMLLAGMVALMGLLAGCGGETAVGVPSEGTAAALGTLASFRADTLDGDVFTDEDVGERDVTVVNFWAMTCRPCIAELPELAEFAAALPENVQVITCCLDGYGNEEAAAEVLADAGFTGVTLISGDGDLAELCGGLQYTPTTVFADSNGVLVGDAVIGGQEDLSGTFLAAVNQVLAAGGKDEVSLGAA